MTVRLATFMAFLLIHAAASAEGDPAAEGRTIYREGKLPDGSVLRARVNGGASLAGAAVSCVRCHRRSGMGMVEGSIVVPPITAQTLFTSTTPRRADLLRELYQEDIDARALSAVHSLKARPAYDPASLGRALREGIAPGERTLDPAMPRFDLNDDAVASLFNYLRTLGRAASPGVDASTIHFATIICEGVGEPESGAVRAVVGAFARWHNWDVRQWRSRPVVSPRYKDESRTALREWDCQIWRLAGAPETWAAQLETRYRTQPVFALLGGVGSQTWAPIQRFCEEHEIPCLFPNTTQPGSPEENQFTIYLSEGIFMEARALAKFLIERAASLVSPPHRIVQFVDDSAASRAGSAALAKAMPHGHGWQIETRAWRDVDELRASGALEKPASCGVLWLPADGAQAAARALADRGGAEVFVSGGMLSGGANALDRIPELPAGTRLISPWTAPDFTLPHTYRVRAWLGARGIDLTHERLKMNTWFALSATEHALNHLIDFFSRDYLIERIEHETERGLNPGVFPRLSLAPGQRFASKGCYILESAREPNQAWRPVSSWLVP